MNNLGTTGDFTTEQLEIVNLPVDAHALVSAAAGTGKTHTLAGRLTWLVEGEGLSAGDEVLVLSFSRAAVAELRRRIRAWPAMRGTSGSRHSTHLPPDSWPRASLTARGFASTTRPGSVLRLPSFPARKCRMR